MKKKTNYKPIVKTLENLEEEEDLESLRNKLEECYMNIELVEEAFTYIENKKFLREKLDKKIDEL